MDIRPFNENKKLKVLTHELSSSSYIYFQIKRKKKRTCRIKFCMPKVSEITSILNKVFLQTSLERNLINSSYIFILSVNFENLTVRLHVLITSLMLTKFQENQRSIAMLLNKYYYIKFLYSKVVYKK